MSKNILFLILLLIFHLFILFNLQFTAWPEMFSYPYLKNNGYLLYKDMIHPYPPILTLGLSFVYKIFGYQLEALKIITWLAILMNDVLIFLIIRKLTKNINYSLLGLLFYILIQPFLEGNMMWFDLAIVPPILLGLYFLISEKNFRNLFLSGLFFGIAAFIKQTTGVFLIIVPFILLYRKTELKKIFFFLTGPVLIFLTLVVKLVQENALYGFFEWTLINPFLYWSKFPGYVQMNPSQKDMFLIFLLTLPLLIFFVKLRKKLMIDKYILLLFIFLVTSILLVYPRFSFFHLQLFIAFTAIFFGHLLFKIRVKSFLIIFYFLLIFGFIARPSLVKDWQKEIRFYRQEDQKIIKIISDLAKKEEKIFLLGLNSSIYALSDRLPPKPWTDNFGWYLEIPGVQKEIIDKWEENPPAIVLWKESEKGNWFDLGTYQPGLVTNWIKDNYTNRGEVYPEISMWEKNR